MIAAVKGWYAAWAALLVFCPLRANAADDPRSAARELAAKTAGFTGGGAPVTVIWRNASSLASAESAQIRGEFENAIRQAGGRIADGAPIEIRLTVSENPSEYLLVEDARRGDDRQVWISSWKRVVEPAHPLPHGVSLERRLVWEQDEQILDVAFPDGAMVVLSPSNITFYLKVDGQWQAQRRLPISPSRPWPRDLHGRLRSNGTAFQAYLPGMTCTGNTQPALAMECKPKEEPWVVESGSRTLLLADFAASRNYFDGHVVAQNGTPHTVSPFYTAATMEASGETFWLMAQLDGRTQVYDTGLTPLAGTTLAGWGSDIAGIDARCGPSSQVLATRPGDGSEGDSIQAFGYAERGAMPVSAPTTFSGTVTALWTSGGNSAVAVAHDLTTGRYAAYIVTVACGS